jgi:hypothetical protein
MNATQARIIRELDLRMYQAQTHVNHMADVGSDAALTNALAELDHEHVALDRYLAIIREDTTFATASEDTIVAAAYSFDETAVEVAA